MDTDTHRKRTIAGLRDLADFLYEHPVSAPLHTAGAIEATYCILDDNADAARAEFADAAEFLEEYADEPEQFLITETPHNNTVQHSASLAFGEGTVQYHVLWIERNETEDGQ